MINNKDAYDIKDIEFDSSHKAMVLYFDMNEINFSTLSHYLDYLNKKFPNEMIIALPDDTSVMALGSEELNNWGNFAISRAKELSQRKCDDEKK